MRRAIAVLAGLLLSGSAIAQTTPNWALHYVPPPAEWNGLWASKQDYNAPGVFTTLATVGNATITGNLTVTGTINGGGGSFLPLIGGTLSGDLFTAGRIVSSAGQLRFVNNGASAILFQNAAGGNSFNINGSASVIANGVTVIPQPAGNGPTISATGTDANIALKLSGKGTSAVQVNLSGFSVTPSSLVFTGGVAPVGQFTYSSGASGTINTAAPAPMVSFSLLGDTTSKALTSGFFPFFQITKNWGGGSQQGQQQAFRVQMTQTGAVSGNTPPLNIQMGAAGIFADYSFNLGGTSLVPGFAVGAAYSLIPAVWLHPGATNYDFVGNVEWDIQVDGTEQDLTLGGTVTAGDTITTTFTSSSIVGSPVSVVATAGTGDVLQSLVNKVVGVILNNPALANAGVSASPDRTVPPNTRLVKLYWQTQNTTTISVAVGGAASETAALGSVVGGSSTIARSNNTLTNRGTGRAGQTGGSFTPQDTMLNFDTLKATTGGSSLTAMTIGGGVFPIAPGGSILQIIPQRGGGGAANTEPFWSPQLFSGFDLRPINWTQYNGFAYLSQGFGVTGTGALNLQNAVISVTSTGLVLDVPSGRIGAGNPSIVNGGGGGAGVTTDNYFVGDIVSGVNGTDINGGQYLVTAVNASTGAVSPGGLTTLVQPSTTTASLGVAIATTGGSGTGLTITPTATTNSGISLAPSGGPTTVGGSLAVTGTLTGPTTTQAIDTNTTAIASTAFVLAQASAVLPLIDGTAAIGTSTRFARADHVHPTDTTRAALTGATFAGTLQVGSNTTQQATQLNGPAGVNRLLAWLTASSKRWQVFTNSAAEGGANAGSDFQIQAFDDTGTLLTTPLTITRSTGLFNFATAVKFSGSNIVANGAIATTMTSLGPTGSHTTIQEWLTIQNSGGTTRYIPLY